MVEAPQRNVKIKIQLNFFTLSGIGPLRVNIEMKIKSLGYDKLDELRDLFNLTNLIKSEICFTKNYKSLID